jgi:hypothetical protein
MEELYERMAAHLQVIEGHRHDTPRSRPCMGHLDLCMAHQSSFHRACKSPLPQIEIPDPPARLVLPHQPK